VESERGLASAPFESGLIVRRKVARTDLVSLPDFGLDLIEDDDISLRDLAEQLVIGVESVERRVVQLGGNHLAKGRAKKPSVERSKAR
jgi:hypothetical protein